MNSFPIQKLLHVTPFVSFTVHVADGRVFTLQHPDFAALAQGGRMRFVSTKGDKSELIDVFLITRVQSSDPQPRFAA